MKSIQIILLLCIHLGETFPPHIAGEHVDINIKALVQRGLIKEDLDDVCTGYDVTSKGKEVLYALYDCFQTFKHPIGE